MRRRLHGAAVNLRSENGVLGRNDPSLAPQTADATRRSRRMHCGTTVYPNRQLRTVCCTSVKLPDAFCSCTIPRAVLHLPYIDAGAKQNLLALARAAAGTQTSASAPSGNRPARSSFSKASLSSASTCGRSRTTSPIWRVKSVRMATHIEISQVLLAANREPELADPFPVGQRKNGSQHLLRGV